MTNIIKKSNISHAIFPIIGYTMLILTAITTVLPFYWSLITSLRTTQEIMALPVSFFPKKITFEHYINLFNDMPWAGYFGNTVFVTLCGVFGNLFFGSLAAYAFSKMFFRGKKAIMKIFYASMMLPSMVLLIPQYLVLMRFPLMGGNNILGQGGTGMIDSFAGIIIPGCVGVYSMLFLRQFFLSTPNEIGEAAQIDGAGEFKRYLLYIKMIAPGLATLGLFSFNGFWNSYLMPSIVLQDESLWLLSIALKNYNVFYTDNYGPLMAGSIVVIIPVFIVFLFAQKYFINNIAVSGMKL